MGAYSPSPDDLLNDPTTPYWAISLINQLDNVDPVDAANVLEVLAEVYGARADRMSR